jgi:hypothetical protein
LEYDRHSWGTLLAARADYVAEIMPVILLNEPAKYGINSIALTKARQVECGVGIYPIGGRLLWRRNRTFKPYLGTKAGILHFEKNVLSTEGARFNYSLQLGTGVEMRMSRRVDLRLGCSDLHFSNGDTARHNPGIDFIYLNAGPGFRFGP